MPYTTINKSSLYRNTTLITGNNSTQAFTGLGFAPAMIWTKKRNGATNHLLYDKVRGVGKYLYPNLQNAEGGNGTDSALSAFGTDGFTLTSGDDANGSGATGVAWSWKAGTTGSGTTTGSGIGKAYSYSVDTTSGFSVIKYVGNGSSGHTIPHHLGVTPALMIVKRVNSASTSWMVYHKDLGATKNLILDGTNAVADDDSIWNDVAPNATNFTCGSSTSTNGNDDTYMCYAFVEKVGYSKVSSYTGNGNNTQSPLCYCGFKPKFLLGKRSDAAGQNWFLLDTTRQEYNNRGNVLYPEVNYAEGTTYYIDMLSNGWRWNVSGSGENGSGNTYIFMAIGQTMVGTNNIPATGR